VNFASPVMSSTWERSRFLDIQFRSWTEQDKPKKANVKALISLLELSNLNHEMI
jgi:N-acyl-L-homoserine lactone synthetase